MPTNDQFAALVEEVGKQTDRGAAIIAASALDELLNVAIQARLAPLNRERYDAIFGLNGSLGTLSAKIELGFALGLYSGHGLKALHAIRDVRNAFSHSILPLTFDHPDVIEKSRNLIRLDGLPLRDCYLATFVMSAMLLISYGMSDVRIRPLHETNPDSILAPIDAFSPGMGEAARKLLQTLADQVKD